MTSTPEVRAAGGVVVRRDDGTLRLLLVHRPKYDDWSFPKGKLDDGESFEEAAVREVLEETALRCRRTVELPPTNYHDAEGRPKVVRYWLMEAEAGDAESRPADLEVDVARWLAVDEALRRLTYPRDRELVSAALEVLGRRDSGRGC